jgi:hypothetical protein
MNTLSLQKTVLRMITALCLAAVIFSLGASVQASPEASLTVSSIDAFQQVAPGQGWILFDGKLYWTNNDGAAWTDITPPKADIEAVTFLDASRGSSQLLAIVSAVDGYALTVTSDSGAIWQTRVLNLPALARVNAPIAKVFMGWRTDLHGWLVFKLATGSNFSRGVLFVTDDGGVTWAERTVPLGEPVTFADENNGWVTGGSAGNQTFGTHDGGISWESVPENGDQLKVQNEAGWKKRESGECAENVCVREVQLLTRRDGVNWEAMRLPSGQTSLRESFSGAVKSSLLASRLADADTNVYVGQGFDTCEIPNLTRMQTWWNSSPYSAVNLYIGGISRACSNPLLSASYLLQLNAQGWRLIPTWVGLQASCSSYTHRMSSTAATAYNQGMAEADAASAAAQALGLTEADSSGTVIYYDLEYYSGDAICRNAAKAFIDGWSFQLRARGNLAGVYGSPCNAIDWTSLANVPDALWIANWVASSYTPTASVFGAVCLGDQFWPTHQRLRQYAGGHNETWGGLTLNIDSNVLDGPLTVPNGTGGTSAPSAPSNPNPADGSAVAHAGDTWLYWKTTGDTCSVHVWGGALDTTSAGNCSSYHLGEQSTGAYSWQVTATNGIGSTIGPVWSFNIRPAPPSDLSAVPVSSTRVNLTWLASTDAVDGYLVFANEAQVASVAGNVTSYQVQNLTCNSSHSFYVKAVLQGIESDASNTANATISSCAPALVSPLKGALVNSLQPKFTWQAADGTAYYQIQVSLNSSFTGNAVDTTTSAASYTPAIRLTANKRYYWRVRAVSTLGIVGPWSAAWNFRTAIRPPRLISPANGITLPNRRPTFDWSDVTGASSYTLQVSSKANFSSILRTVLMIGSTYSAPSDLPVNVTLYWRVRANGVNGPSVWSAVWWFHTP